MATVTLYLGQFQDAATGEWKNAGEWSASHAEATVDLQMRAPKDRTYRVLASAAEVLEPAAGPTLTSLTPATAVVGGPDVTLQASGTGFDASAVILWNGSPEPTTYVSATEVTTVVKPSTASGPAVVPVSVTTVLGATAALDFTFTAAP